MKLYPKIEALRKKDNKKIFSFLLEIIVKIKERKNITFETQMRNIL